MLKTFFASTAIVSTLAFAALAQDTADPLVNEPDAQAPAEMAPSAQDPAIEAQSTEPTTPMATEPATETAEDPAATPLTTEPATETAQEPAGMMGDQALTPLEFADISADQLIGATIQNPDGENIAEVNDVLLSQDGAVESVVAQFGGFLGFGSNTVKLMPDEITVYEDASGTYVVQTALTPDDLKNRPEYTPEQE